MKNDADYEKEAIFMKIKIYKTEWTIFLQNYFELEKIISEIIDEEISSYSNDDKQNAKKLKVPRQSKVDFQ